MVFTFSGDTDMSSVASGDFTVTGTGACPISPLSGFSKSGQTATLTFNNTGCVSGNALSVSLNMALVADALGNAGSGLVSRTYTLDNTGPVSATISLATTTVSSFAAPVVFTFPSDVDMATVTSADFTVTKTGTCPANPLTNFAKSGQTASLTLSSTGCTTGNTISVSLNMAGVSDSVGNAGSGTVSATYFIDVTGPAAPLTNIAEGLQITLPSTIVLTFDTDTDMSTVTAGLFTVVGTGGCTPNSLNSVSISGYTVSIGIKPCALGTEKINIDMSSIKDAYGNPGVGTNTKTYYRVL